MLSDDQPGRECWFLKCSRSPNGELHGDNGFSVAVCEKHGVAGESFGWEKYDRFGDDGGSTNAD